MRLYKYRNYTEYKKAQIKGNLSKIKKVWVQEENIKYLSEYLRDRMEPRFGICHGTRRGLEQLWFRKYLFDCEVIGTEISPTAHRFPFTVRWDFNKVREEWVGLADFVYSNSFDHSYDPARCLRVWLSYLKSSGLCVIEHTSKHNCSQPPTLIDPFCVDLQEIPSLIQTWTDGNFYIYEILSAPVNRAGIERTDFVVIGRML